MARFWSEVVKLTATKAKEIIWKQRPREYYEACLKIEHKGCAIQTCECKRNIARLAPLRLNTHQDKIQQAVDLCRKQNRPIRLKILKPRQTGISTETEAIMFHAVRFFGGSGMVVSHDFDSAEHIYKMGQRFYNNLPDAEAERLPTEKSNRKELQFADPHGGRILVETAGKTSAGHSFTIRYLHLSEVARWPEGCDDAIVGLLNSVPDEPDTVVIIESVANGMTGWFYTFWHEENDYIPIFLPWSEHSEYQKPLPCERHIYIANLEDEEKKLIARHDLTLEQIEFRRWAILNKCKKDPEKFKEQYPATAEEAFISSGSTFFDFKALDVHETREPARGNLRIVENFSGEDILFSPTERGNLRLFVKPQKGKEYVIGCDVAEGIEIEGAPADDRHDYSSADILDRDTGEQVAHYNARVTPDEFGRQLALLGRWYNHAYIGVENNGGYGQHVLTTLLNDEKHPYPAHLLYRDYQTQKYGWSTTKANRKTLCANLDMAQRAQEIFIRSSETVREMRAFVTKPDGRIEAGQGNKDDRVFSLAIANKMLEVAPPRISHNTPVAGMAQVIRYGGPKYRRAIA